MQFYSLKPSNTMQTQTLTKFLKSLQPIELAWLQHNSYFLEITNVKLPKRSNFNSNQALHYIFYIMLTEYQWTLHNTDYTELEQAIMLSMLNTMTNIDPLLKPILDTGCETPAILFQS